MTTYIDNINKMAKKKKIDSDRISQVKPESFLYDPVIKAERERNSEVK